MFNVFAWRSPSSAAGVWFILGASAACSASGGADPPGGATGAGGVPSGGFNIGGNSGTPGGGGVIQGQPSTPSQIDECSGSVDAATLDAFRNASAGGIELLYPYDATVFPRGLLAPTLQWNQSGSVESAYLRMRSSQFSYEGCFGAISAPYRLPIPEVPWRGAGEWNAGPGDPVEVTLVTRGGGTTNAVVQRWSFALASIKGAIYYNTYTSALANLNGAVMKVTTDQAQPTAFLVEPIGLPPLGPCFSCHALSADGSTMFANNHSYPLGPYESRSFSVSAAGAQQMAAGIAEAGFAGVFPDGSRAMTNGPPSSSSAASALFPYGEGNVPALVGPAVSHLIDSRTGQQIPAPGWDGQVSHAQMPMFSPDGRHIVYNDHDQGQGHALWVADFDPATNTFSNRRELFRDPSLYPGWPFFTPDSAAVIFALGTRSDFVSQVPDRLTLIPDQVGRSDLRIVYLAAPGQATALDLANGYRNGNSYLPKQDNNYEFFPTVSPVAAGGYFWVFFTSRRTYGNIWEQAPGDPTSKKIWVSAISIGGQPGMDVSHPAFFLPGQEIESGNIRAFAALEPCKEDGQACTNGTDCCSGFCVDGVCRPPQGCSNLDDRCESAADCCNPSHRCIGGFCAQLLQ